MDHGNHLHHGPGGPQAPWEDEAALAAVGALCSETRADPVIKRGYLMRAPGPDHCSRIALGPSSGSLAGRSPWGTGGGHWWECCAERPPALSAPLAQLQHFGVGRQLADPFFERVQGDARRRGLYRL